jgi:TonB-dependent receptor
LNNQTPRLNPLTSSIAFALGAISIQPAIAQNDEESFVEEVIVTGVRKSLIDSAEIKRDSDGVVDAISAEDIGKFPDTNLAESLQRITGVSIDRASYGGAVGEGQRITVRGIGPDYNLVLLNGRQMPATTIAETGASNSRAFDFAALASEAVSGVDVYKTSMSNMPTGGIGATVNVRTARPLDLDGRRISLGAKIGTDTSAQDSSWTPEVSGIYADTFADGTFGIALTGSYSERDFGYNQAAATSGWRAFKGDENNWGTIPQPGTPGSENITNRPDPDDTYSVPQNMLYAFNEVTRERTNGQLVLQWRPIESVTATLDYTYSELEIQTKRSDLSAWMNFGPSVTSWTDGPVSSPLFYQELYDGFPTDVGAGGAQFGNKIKGKSLGFNLEWMATDRLGFALDYHDSQSTNGSASPYGTSSTLGGVGFYRGTTSVDYAQDLPVLFMETPNGLDASQMLTGGASYRNSYMKAEVEQIDLSGYFDTSDSSTLEFGVTRTEVNNRSAFSNVQYDNWGGIGTPDDYSDDLWQTRNVSGLFSNVPGHDNPALFDEMFFWDFASIVAEREAATGQSHAASDDFTTDRLTSEKSSSAYLQWKTAFDIGDMFANFRVGIRYEQTDVKSSALVPISTGILWVGTNEFSVTQAEPDFTDLEGDYNYWLPNLDFNIEVTDGVVLRASYSETIGRPGWGDIQGGQTLNTGARIDGGTGQSGDPGLLPLESKNIDFSAEWYYGEGSYLSAGYFHKDVKNYVGSTQITQTPFDLPHPAQGAWYAEGVAACGCTDPQQIRQYIFDTYADSQYVEVTGVGTNGFTTGTILGQPGDTIGTFQISIPANQDDAEIDGWEIAWQHMFGQSGFGLIANYTMVNSDLKYDNLSLGPQFAIEGLADSANLVAFYDKNNWIVRAAYNWRDDFLTARFDGNGLPNPMYTQAYGQIDGLVSYSFNNGWTVFAEGFNLTNEYIRLYGRAEKQTMFVTTTGRRYGIGARWTF